MYDSKINKDLTTLAVGVGCESCYGTCKGCTGTCSGTCDYTCASTCRTGIGMYAQPTNHE